MTLFPSPGHIKIVENIVFVQPQLCDFNVTLGQVCFFIKIVADLNKTNQEENKKIVVRPDLAL